MYLFQRVSDLQTYLTTERVNNRSVGFVPTMGVLHAGHLKLVKRSLAENQITVASIFVNPTQFNDASDLEKYPRTLGKDLEMLAGVGCDVVFLPQVATIYPTDLNTEVTIDFGGLDQVLEGAQRPGHFAGVAQVVNRLLNIVQPHYLYLGQKDYQQQLIIKRLIAVLQLPVKVVVVATERESDGLAMSSRNSLLDPELRPRSVLLQQTLEGAKNRLAAGEPVPEIEKWALEQLTQPDFNPEYFSIVNGENLLPPDPATLPDLVVACTAVWAGKVRLIDNLVLRGSL